MQTLTACSTHEVMMSSCVQHTQLQRPIRTHRKVLHGNSTVVAASRVATPPGPLLQQPAQFSGSSGYLGLLAAPDACRVINVPQPQTPRQHVKHTSRPKLPRHLGPVHHKVLADIRSRQLLSKGEHILICVSGDMASLSLAKLLLDLSGAWDWKITVALDASLSSSPASAHHQQATSSLAHAQQLLATWGQTGIICCNQDPLLDAALSMPNGVALGAASAAACSIVTGSSAPPAILPSHGHVHSNTVNDVLGHQHVHPSIWAAALQHGCSAVIIATTATDCAVHLLGSMLRGVRQQAHPTLHSPAFTTNAFPHLSRSTKTATVPRIVRPLLGVSEHQLQAFAEQQQLLPGAQLHMPLAQLLAWPQTAVGLAGAHAHAAGKQQLKLAPSNPLASSHSQPDDCDASFIRSKVLPYVRREFSQSVDQVLARAAMILTADDTAASVQRHRKPPASSCQSGPVAHGAACGQVPVPPCQDDWPAVHEDKVASVQQSLLQQVSNMKQLRHVRKVLVAVSGGQDSLALLRLLLEVKEELGWEIVVGHCDHRWRADSAANAQHVQQLCATWGVPCVVRTVHDQRAVRTEALARRWRYASLVAVARETGCQVVVTGHTRTDVIETQLLNLIRGAGPAGMLSLKAVRQLGLALTPHRVRRRQLASQQTGDWARQRRLELAPKRDGLCSAIARNRRNSGFIRRGDQTRQRDVIWTARPLIGVTREDTGFVCDHLGLPVWLDSTNLDASVARRNKIRLQLMPLLKQQFGGGVEAALAAHAAHVSRVSSALERAAEAAFKQVVARPSLSIRRYSCQHSSADKGQGLIKPAVVWVHEPTLDADAVSCLPLALQRRVVMKLLQGVPALRARVTFDVVEEVLQLVGAPNRARTSTLVTVPLDTLPGLGQITAPKPFGAMTAVLEGRTIRVECQQARI